MFNNIVIETIIQVDFSYFGSGSQYQLKLFELKLFSII